MNPLLAIAAAASVATCCGLAVVGAGASVKASASAPTGVAARAADGHYWAETEIEGRKLRLLVDTGASAVALTAADASQLGLDVEHLAFTQKVATARGELYAAQVTLPAVTVGGARIENVRALVVRQGMPASLLGMSYLGRLSGFEGRDGALIFKR